jgi:hypothetical protein
MLPTASFLDGKSRSSTAATLTDLSWDPESSMLSADAIGAFPGLRVGGFDCLGDAALSLGAPPKSTAKYTPAPKLSTATAAARPRVIVRFPLPMGRRPPVRIAALLHGTLIAS